MPVDFSRLRHAFLSGIVALGLVALPVAALGQTREVQAEGGVGSGQDGDERQRDPDEQESDEPGVGWNNEANDPCALEPGGNWIDWMNRAVTRSVCGTARWFDSFFGTLQEYEDREATFGRLALGTLWDEDDGFDPELRFRAKIHFPGMNNRLNAIVGRGSQEQLRDRGNEVLPPDSFSDDDSEWLVGFGYHLARSNRNRVTFNLGTSISRGLDPYLRLRYVHRSSMGPGRSFRVRLTPQWQNSVGFGFAARVSLDRMLGDRMLLRWGANARNFEDRFDGTAYGMDIQLFQNVAVGRALRYAVGLASQSGLEHQPQDAFVRVTWRESVYREIYFLEAMVGSTYRRRPGEPQREAELLLGLLFELKFGR